MLLPNVVQRWRRKPVNICRDTSVQHVVWLSIIIHIFVSKLFAYLYQNYSVCRLDQNPTEGKNIYRRDYLQERGLEQAVWS